MPSHRLAAALALLLAFAACKPAQKTLAAAAATSSPAGASSGASITIENGTDHLAVVTIVFGSDTVVKGWPFCKPTGPACSFTLEGKASKALPLGGQYLNATLVFDGRLDGALCGETKAEFNVNNPKWYDILDVSLVDGFSNKMEIIAVEPVGSSTRIGPPAGRDGNEKVFGLYPYGCDICVARQPPMSCGIASGGAGCKGGTQYKPDVPCQYQGSVMGGGTVATVRLL